MSVATTTVVLTTTTLTDGSGEEGILIGIEATDINPTVDESC
jgi:hypothetical protein